MFPSRLFAGRRALDLAAVLKRKIRLAFERIGITAVGRDTLRHTVGTVLAETGRASIHHPRLLRSLESQCDQQVFAGGIEHEAQRPDEPGRGHSSGAHPARESEEAAPP